MRQNLKKTDSMKGFIEHVIKNIEEVEKELERDLAEGRKRRQVPPEEMKEEALEAWIDEQDRQIEWMMQMEDEHKRALKEGDAYFFMEKEFAEWVVSEGAAPSTGKAYVNYMKKLISDFYAQILPFSFMRVIPQALYHRDERLIDLFNKLDSRLYTEIREQKVTDSAKHSLQNYRTGLKRYMDFVCSLLDEEAQPASAEAEEETPTATDCLSETIRAIRPDNASKTSADWYDLEALKKNFTLRLITQDRCYGDVYFPIRLLKTLFGQQRADKAFFQQWINQTLEQIQLHTDKGSFRLKEVKELSIQTDGQVQVVLKSGITYTLYTAQADGQGFHPIRTTLLRHIVIDHITPMQVLLARLADQLPALRAVTRMMQQVYGGKVNPLDIIAVKNAVLKRKQTELTSLIPALKDELRLIQPHTELQLMDRKENSQKRNRIV